MLEWMKANRVRVAMVAAAAVLVGVLLAGCTVTVSPGTPPSLKNPYAKQFDGKLGGDPAVDAINPPAP